MLNMRSLRILKQYASSHNHLLTVLLALVIAILIIPNINADETKISEELESLLIEQPKALENFKLQDQHKNSFTQDNLKNKWTFVFFGYTNCPDVCPTTMAELDNAASQLKSFNTGSNQIQYVFVSIDPQRDTPEHLADYVSYFSTKFVAATGEEEQLKRFASPLRIGFRVGFKTKTTYFMDHGASMILIDPQARYYARFRAPHYAEELVSKFKMIMEHQKANGNQTKSKS